MTSLSPVSGPAASRVAVLIDGDNIPQSFRPEIDRHAREMGRVVSGQVFGDIALHSDWAKEAGEKTERPILALVKELIRTKGDATGLEIVRLNSLHGTIGFRASQTPEKQWRAWLRARPDHFELDPKGPESRVRLVASASATAPNAARSGP
ncbi:hypothetical protein HYN69_01560 [Gemmobacter aquarius]|uniref:NYN domain-containing protein n=1 Tax=Paragemmobacter aquarius TaxID=2169400 RepID=A0A2S0UHS7_9RHOB|nr:hypothetical protein [Gemmobacter aquarius]AWB47366.1 hypothetical protein HYN69_01560 [Gemmobacter aquarius]